MFLVHPAVCARQLHAVKGVRVFVDTHDEPVLLAYCRLQHRYFVLLYTRHRAWYGVTSFDALLDAVPIQSMTVGNVDLSVEPTVEATVHAWQTRLRTALGAS